MIVVAMTGDQAAVVRDVDVSARHREHHRPGRPHALLVRLSQEEKRLVDAAAEQARLTPTGFAAKAAVTAAGAAGGPAVASGDLRELQRELFAAPRAVNMFGSNVNQAAAAYNATGQLPEWANQAVRPCAAAVARWRGWTTRCQTTHVPVMWTSISTARTTVASIPTSPTAIWPQPAPGNGP